MSNSANPDSDQPIHSDLGMSENGEIPASTLSNQLEETILSFEDIQAELHYKHAEDVLRDLINHLDLTPRERMGLEEEIHSLDKLLEKLERSVIHIAVFGMVGRGKSSLLNALLGQDVFETGPIHGVTRQIESVRWQVSRESVSDSADQDILRVSLKGVGQSRIELIDTPGIDEVEGAVRQAMAERIAKQADLILFIIAGDMTQVEFKALSQLRQASKPILLVFNKIDQYPEADRQLIYQKIRDDRIQQLISPDEIVMAAASPMVARAVRRPDGQMIAQLNRGTPQIDDLKLKILELLHRDGKSLVALNTMLYADDVNDQLLQRKIEIRDRSADDTIWNAVMTKAVAIALNPVTVMDLLGGAAIDVAMILTLSRLYGISMTQQGAINLLRSIALGMGGVAASELLVTFGLGSLKSLLGATAISTGGLSLTPYMSVALTQAAVAGVSSYSIGQVAKAYLANGAAWGPDGPKAVVSDILESLDETSILSRIKDELKAKLDVQNRNKPGA